ncbi:hypothetical protein Leryth_015839 [Lithospermum erythrorhizon]|nr:hypothetical protein Leryth_015839 [Lithospermum erythrorhizon]
MAKTSRELLPSNNKRQFNWTTKISNEDGHELSSFKSLSFCKQEEKPTGDVPNVKSNLVSIQEEKKERDKQDQESSSNTTPVTKKKLQVAVSRLRLVLTAAMNKHRGNLQNSLGPRVVGTLFGHRKGHVHFAFQRDASSRPVLIVELATPISGLVKEMASGLVRIALECDKNKDEEKNKGRLLEQPLWRTYCNGKRCGFATIRECGLKELGILKAVEPISMGAGVLPCGEGEEGGEGGENDGDIMYMRAKFERVVGSGDSEAFYMMNPDCNGAPELSIYLLRV